MLQTDKGDFIGFVDDKAEIFKQRNTFVGIVQLFDAQHIVADVAQRLKIDVRKFAARNLQFFKRKFVVDFFAACGLFAFCRVRCKAQDEFAQILHFFFALFCLIFCLSLHDLTHLIPKIVVARKLTDLPVVDVANVRAHRVQKVAVVADDDNRVRKID